METNFRLLLPGNINIEYFFLKLGFKGLNRFQIVLFFSMNPLLGAAEFVNVSGDFCLPIERMYIFVQD